MIDPTASFSATGMLLRGAGGFVLRVDGSVAHPLEMQRVPVDLIEKRVTVAGVLLACGAVEVHSLRPD